jgi:hypothetical protein
MISDQIGRRATKLFIGRPSRGTDRLSSLSRRRSSLAALS